MNHKPSSRSGKAQETPTWEPSRLKAVAWPKTGAGRPAARAAPGLRAWPLGPWSTGADGSLGSTHQQAIIKRRRGKETSLVVASSKAATLHAQQQPGPHMPVITHTCLHSGV